MEELTAEIAAEKERTKELQALYDGEKVLRIRAESSLHELRKVHEKMAVKGEMEEEMIVNKLLSKISEVQQDKEKLAIDLEREEECLTNNLQKQLKQVGIEKEETEAEVENLKRQLEEMRTEREKIARLVEAEQELLSNNLFRKLQKTLAEKAELENQLSRSTSAGTSRSGSISFYGANIPSSHLQTAHMDSPTPSPVCTRLSVRLEEASLINNNEKD